jgi:hypothetical protein
MNDQCVRARGWLAQWADGELPAAKASWIESHWEECADCRGERDRFQGLDGRLLSIGESIASSAEPAAERLRFLARIDELEGAGRRPPAFLPPVTALLAAAAVLVMWLPRPAPRAASNGWGFDQAGFVAVPYVPPIASYERSSVVSMQIPVANLLAEGYSLAGDPSSVVQADILLGEDGRMHAVRLAANRILRGIGE